MTGAPDNWYDFNFPLEEVRLAPVPSQANYNAKNVAPLIESFAGLLGTDKSNVSFRYENNTPNNANDDIVVSHPNDADYLGTFLSKHNNKSPEMLRYENAAKRSARLAEFERNSPADIVYFKNRSGA
jgi:hypothetical protein